MSNFFGKKDHVLTETPHFELKFVETAFHLQVSKEQRYISLSSGKLPGQYYRGKSLLELGETVHGVEQSDTFSDQIRNLTQQLQLQAEPRELVSRRSSQKQRPRIRACTRAVKANGAGLLLRILTDGEGVRVSKEVNLGEDVKAEVEVQLLAPDRLYQKGLLYFAVMVDLSLGLRISGSDFEIPKSGAVKLLEIDADTGQILPGK